MRWVSIFVLIVVLMSGSLGFLISLNGILDPVGAQTANDADPFGTPPPPSEQAATLIVSGFLIGFGWWGLSKASKTRKLSGNPYLSNNSETDRFRGKTVSWR